MVVSFVSKILAVLMSVSMVLDTSAVAFAAEEIPSIIDEAVSSEQADPSAVSSIASEEKADDLELDIFSDEYYYLLEEELKVIDEAIVEDESAGIDSFDDKTQEELIAETYAEVLSGGVVTYDDASDVARLVQMGYRKVQSEGPISITHGTLSTRKMYGGTEEKDVYVVCLSGTDTDAENQSTGWWTDILVGFERDNRYIQNVRKAVVENIPAGSNVMFAGHSLGGMVAQQAASDSVIKDNYIVLNTVTFGSPLINGFSREGTVKRLGDKVDPVSYLSISSLLNIVWQAAGLNRENGGYGKRIVTAHCESYQRESVWGAYDVTGTKFGGATLTLDLSTLRFYKSPIIVTD